MSLEGAMTRPDRIPTSGRIQWTKGTEVGWKDAGARRRHHRRGTFGVGRRHSRKTTQSRLSGSRAGRAREFDLSLSSADGVLYDARAAGDRRRAVHIAVRKADEVGGP